MRKTLSFILALALCFGITACAEQAQAEETLHTERITQAPTSASTEEIVTQAPTPPLQKKQSLSLTLIKQSRCRMAGVRKTVLAK